MFTSVYFQLTIEMFFGFIGLLIAVKIIGKRQFQQISPFDFISAIVLGEFLGNAIYDNEITILHVLYAISIWTLLVYAVEKVVLKSRRFRRAVEGSPVLLIDRGKIDYQIMKKEKLDFVELLSLIRDRGTYSISEIEYAILEHNGLITLIKKAPFDQVTKGDLNIESKPVHLPLPLIVEGEVLTSNLAKTEHDQDWLRNELRQKRIDDMHDVLYAEWSPASGLYVQHKQHTENVE